MEGRSVVPGGAAGDVLHRGAGGGASLSLRRGVPLAPAGRSPRAACPRCPAPAGAVVTPSARDAGTWAAWFLVMGCVLLNCIACLS